MPVLAPEVGQFIGDTWIDATGVGGGVRTDPPIAVRRGKANWASRPDPSTANFTLDNQDGRWSPDNPSSPYFGNWKRNIPTRIGVPGAPAHLAFRGTSGQVVASTPDTGVSGTRSSPTISVTESATTVAGTSHTVNLPATVTEGDRLWALVFFNGTDITASADLDGWSLERSGSVVASFGYRIYTRIARGDEDGGTLGFTTTGSRTMSAQVIRLVNASQMWETAGFELVVDSSDSFTLNPNSQAVTCTWGAESTNLFITGFFAGATGGTVTANPANYTALADGNASAGVWMGSAYRINNTATEDPGAFTIDDGTAGENVRTWTIAIRGGFAAYGDIANLDDVDFRVEFELDALEVDPQEAVLGGTYVSGTGWKLTIGRDQAGQFGGALGEAFLTFQWGTGAFSFIRSTLLQEPLPNRLLTQRSKVRVTLDADNGAGGSDLHFYYDSEGTWVEIGTGYTESQVAWIGKSDEPLNIGGRGANYAGSFDIPLRGRVYNAQLMESIGSATAEVDVDFEAQTVGDTSFSDDTSRTWTVGADGRITDLRWLFHGEMASIPVRFNVHGRNITVPAEAAGIFRRLRQAKQLESPLTRMAKNGFFTVRHWPMSETGSPTRFAIAQPTDYGLLGDNSTKPVIVTTGRAEGAASDEFIAADPIPTLGTSTWTVSAPSYTDVFGGFEVRFNVVFPEPGPATNSSFLTVVADHTWNIEYRTDSGGQMRVVGSNGITVSSTWDGGNLDGLPFRMGLRVEESGSTVRGTLYGEDQDGNVVINVNSSFVTGTAGPVTNMTINPNSNFEGVAFGSLSLLNDYFGFDPEITEELAGWNGERAGVRILRLCDEEGIEARIIGDPLDTITMGPQQSGTLMDFIEECSETDLGILFEPAETRAVGYRTRVSLSDQSPAIEADYGAQHISVPPNLDRDDQASNNDVEVTNYNGSKGRAVLADGSDLSVSEPPVGLGTGYDISLDVNAQNDNELDSIAQTVLARQTVDEPRISTVQLGIHSNNLPATLQESVLESRLGDIIEISNILTNVLGASSAIEQIIQGRTDTLGSTTHMVEFLTEPGSPYQGTIAPPGGGLPLAFRRGDFLATGTDPAHCLEALGYTASTEVTRSQLDGILDDWVTGTGGTTHNVTSNATWNTAMSNAVPGDLIRITSSFTATKLNIRGDLYGIAGATLTSSTSGGTVDDPIIVTCADGAFVTGTSLTSNDPILAIDNCRHVWAVGFNTDGTMQFGIRCQNWGGTSASPAYVAYCNVQQIRDSSIVAGGWFQTVAASGGTPPAGTQNTWGFSEEFVIEENFMWDPNPGDVSGNPGEGVYLGRGAAPGWVGYAKHGHVRGNWVERFKANGVEAKPGCHHVYITDNKLTKGRGSNGAPIEVCYQASSINSRPSYMDDIEGSGTGDIQIFVIGNKIWDYNISETGATRNQCIIMGMAGVRIGFNVVWAARDSAGLATTGSNISGVLIQTELNAADFGDASTDETAIFNNLFWCHGVQNNGAADTGTIADVVQLNNIIPAGYNNGQDEAVASDFVTSTPSPGVLDDAKWSTYRHGSAFTLSSSSSLVGTGSSISPYDRHIAEDIMQQTFTDTAPSPGPFQVPA